MKNIITYSLIGLTILSSTSYCDQAVDLSKGTPAPYDGVLLDKEKAGKVKNQLIERDEYEKLNQSYGKTIDLYKKNDDINNEKSKMLLDQNINLTKTLNDSRQMSDWTKIGYFLLGVIVTGAAAYGAARLAR